MKLFNQSGIAHMAIIVAAVVIAAVGGVGYYVSTKKDSDKTSNNSSSTTATTPYSTKSADEQGVKAAAKDHFTLVYAKKTQQAWDSTCQEFRNLLPYDKFVSSLESGNFFSIDLSKIDFTKLDIRNNQAKIRGAIGPFQPGYDMEVSLLKKDGKWCIYGYEAKAST